MWLQPLRDWSLFCSKDTFKVEAKDVGFVNAVEVKRDDSGGFTDDWYLGSVRERIRITCFLYANEKNN